MNPISVDSSPFVQACAERIVAEALTLRGVDVRETTMSPYALHVDGREFMHLHAGDEELTCDLRFLGDTKVEMLKEPDIERHPIPHADQRGWVKVKVHSDSDLEKVLRYMKASYESVRDGP